MPEIIESRECFTSYMGEYLMWEESLRKALSAIKSGKIVPKAIDQEEERRRLGIRMMGGSIAVIQIEGFMQKGFSKFGGTSTVFTRQAIRAAAGDPDVDGIMLAIDSGGGFVAGTQELANEITAARNIKSVRAHIDDLGASAAFWIASATELITANEMANIGSIGVVAVLEDTSKAFEMAGIEVHVISTGEHKGSFADGVPITDNQIEEVQERVDDINAFFLKAVLKGRSITKAELNKIADGKVFIAKKALALKLIDKVSSFDDSMQAFDHDLKRTAREARNSRGRSRARLAVAKAKAQK